ncbi:hypothetical protein BC832DRAFT_613908 [Gaertneriomyces semiglobifer]|nr:hypothetical protein BC832DRAFT_613908 [Gaertneriomyces semiglobifer]
MALVSQSSTASICRATQTIKHVRLMRTVPTMIQDAVSRPLKTSTAPAVSSPHPISHIRLVQYNEESGNYTEEQRAFYRHRERVQRWHHQFWTENNRHFQAAKLAYETSIVSTYGRQPTPSELSVFYKDYLNASLERHAAYNSLWWKENTRMLLPALRAELCSLRTSMGPIMHGVDAWWQRLGHAIVRMGGGYRAQGITVR